MLRRNSRSKNEMLEMGGENIKYPIFLSIIIVLIVFVGTYSYINKLLNITNFMFVTGIITQFYCY